jgi:hypothetical protein
MAGSLRPRMEEVKIVGSISDRLHNKTIISFVFNVLWLTLLSVPPGAGSMPLPGPRGRRPPRESGT